MRTLAMLLAIAYVVGASLFIPGTQGRRIDHQISVPIAATTASAPVSAVREKTP
jgi:hypothetical protein